MIMTPVNWRLAPPEMVYIINNAEAPALFVGPEFNAAVKGFASQLAYLLVYWWGQVLLCPLVLAYLSGLA
jgi:hypothetical protein